MFFDTLLAEPSPQSRLFALAIAHAFEVLSGSLIDAIVVKLLQLVGQGVDRCTLCLKFCELGFLGLDGGLLITPLCADLDVDDEKVVACIALQFLLAALVGEGHAEHTVLLVPVAQIVEANEFPVCLLVHVCDKAADDGATQATGMEWNGIVMFGEPKSTMTRSRPFEGSTGSRRPSNMSRPYLGSFRPARGWLR